MSISLIIKGNRRQARRAAAARGVEGIYNVRETTYGEVVCLAHQCHAQQIYKWFGESTALQAPFPTGTLLLYTHLEGR